MTKTLILTTPVKTSNSSNQPGIYSVNSWLNNELDKLAELSPGRQVAIIIEVMQS